MTNWQAQKQQLIEDGYCVCENILDAGMLERVRKTSDQLLAAQSPEHFEAQKSTGSMISVYDDPFFAELVAYQPARDALTLLGYPKPRWSSGFVISKPPKSPALFWHQDWWGWNDPISYMDVPQQLFLMYYLVDTKVFNGCLRVLKGSHRKRHSMHDLLPEAHGDAIRRATDPTHPVYQPLPDDIPVPVKAGDLVIGDARLLHGSYANQSDQRRTVITLWYHPEFDSSPERIQAHLSLKQSRVAQWPKSSQEMVQPLVPTYEGNQEPLEWNREPSDALQ
ncbi:phytanoyl-CoA dioxygenase family protein [Chloroflexi bacterium TSY]|nr:phytanoyl-CoA dioxygenase family protein [Chloroflexi bacterium TSY]